MHTLWFCLRGCDHIPTFIFSCKLSFLILIIILCAILLSHLAISFFIYRKDIIIVIGDHLLGTIPSSNVIDLRFHPFHVKTLSDFTIVSLTPSIRMPLRRHINGSFLYVLASDQLLSFNTFHLVNRILFFGLHFYFK